MKTVLAYALGFSMTFSVIAGGMYFLSEQYPWMFGHSAAQTTEKAPAKPQLAAASGIIGMDGTGSATDSSKSVSETVATLKEMLAAKNDSIATRDDSISQLSKSVSQLQQKNSDASNVIAQLQSQVNSWNNQRRKDLASAYNDMDASAAARIMKNLDDKDVIFILSSVQKKQAGKILGQLDPVRAAKLMMSLGHPK
jgi:flagellar motility protein MotE (MotC chaperone)